MTGGKGKRLGCVAIQHSQHRTRRWARRQALERGRRVQSAWARAERAGGLAGYRRQRARGARQQARSARGTGSGRVACVHRLGQLGQLVARAPGLVFRPGFRLGIVSESLFGLGVHEHYSSQNFFFENFFY